jgi:predicted RNA-binding protein
MVKEKVFLYLENFTVIGFLQKEEGVMLKDCLNKKEEFITLTEVKVLDKEEEVVGEEKFICVNKNKILMAKV